MPPLTVPGLSEYLLHITSHSVHICSLRKKKKILPTECAGEDFCWISMSSHHHLVLSPRTCSCSWEVKNTILKYKTESNDFQIFFDLYLIGYNTKPIYTTSQKFGHTFSFNVFFFIFMTIYIVDSHWRHQNYEWTHMELCSKQKSVK